MGFINPGKSTPLPKRVRKKVRRRALPPTKDNSGVFSANRSILEKLPIELLQDIFSRVGLENNSLIYANKHIHDILRFRMPAGTSGWRPGSEFVFKVAVRNFSHDLNVKLDLVKFHRKLRKLLREAPTLRDHEKVQDLKKTMVEFATTHRYAIDLSIINYRFVNLHLIQQLLRKKYLFLDANKISMETDLRRKVLALKLKEITKLKLEANSESQDETLEKEITSLEKSLSDYNQQNYFPEITSPTITESKLDILKCLHEAQKIAFSDNTRIMKNLLRHSPQVFLKYYTFIVDATSDGKLADGYIKVSQDTLIFLFEKVSYHEDYDNWTNAVRYLLQNFYSHNPGTNDHQLWEKIKQCDESLFDIITEFSQPPASFI